MAHGGEFSSFGQFWPYYVAMHSRPLTRWLHLAGTTAGAVVAADGVLRRRRLRAVGWWPALGYSFAWPAHFLVEKNNPASFGHPLWSVRGDLRMTVMMLAGRDRELSAIAQAWLGAHPKP